MTPFCYRLAGSEQDAIAQSGANARFLGGGSNLVDLLRQNVERADMLVDVG